LPEDFGLLQSLINAALPAQEAGDLLSTEKSMRECSALAARIGEPWGRAVALTNLSDIELQQGRFQDAAAHAAEGSSIFDDIGDSHGHATALNNLAAAELELMQTNAAIGHLTESLHEVGREDLADAYFGCIDGLAAAEASRGHAEAAARLLGFADAIRARTNFALQGFERVRRARTLAMLADQLDASAIADARADGAMLDLNEGVELALQTSS
jgi:hypothetical protein